MADRQTAAAPPPSAGRGGTPPPGTPATTPPSLADIDALAQAAVERLPEPFRSHLADVLLRVEDFPDAEVVAAMELDSEWDILGLYHGRHVGLKGDVPTGALPDVIFLYRRPILEEWCETGESLEALVTHVLVHEVGHHFGLSDADMERIEAAAS
ncbi:MAG: metallopeptidase family protein [Sphingomonadaceae bacterium]|nr:metallopeptidase family protein [Sphingomonadaceae bacterium]